MLPPENTENSAQKWWVLVSIGLGTFMSALDGSVVNTILPVLQTHFGSTIATIEWVVTVYLLVVSSLLLTVGRLGDMNGNKRVYALGFVIFLLGSALCGLAGSALGLILARALQAIGAAMLFANSPAILTKVFPARQRGQALGLQATMTYLGLTVGPSLGGWLTEQFSWRAVFYINIPVGLLALALSLRYIPSDRRTDGMERFDLAGAALFGTGLVALLLGLNQGAAWGWTSLPTLGLLAAAVGLLTGFIAWERQQQAPMLDLSLFHNRTFTTAVSSALLSYMCLYAVIFLLPYYLIQGRNLSPAQTGLILTAQPIVMALVAPISGGLSDKIGSRLLTTLGMLIVSGGMVFLSFSGASTATGQILAGLGIVGLGMALFASPNNSALMGSAPAHRRGIAAGMLATARNVGMVLGIGLAGAILTSIYQPTGSDTLFHAVQAGLLAGAGLALVAALLAALRDKAVQPAAGAAALAPDRPRAE
ncbi:MAG TPA: MFS transporter [Anaerolineaceae bacterium]|nr:MFS transporter [Anaerolineaceae bacterium]